MQNAGYIIVSKLFLIAIIPETIFAYFIFYDLREITKIYLDHREINRYGISIQLSCISWLFFLSYMQYIIPNFYNGIVVSSLLVLFFSFLCKLFSLKRSSDKMICMFTFNVCYWMCVLFIFKLYFLLWNEWTISLLFFKLTQRTKIFTWAALLHVDVYIETILYLNFSSKKNKVAYHVSMYRPV